MGGQWRPRIYFIRNTTSITDEGLHVVGKEFACSDEVSDPKYFGDKPGDQIKAELELQVKYFSFRQGYDLGTFNTIDMALRAAMEAVVNQHPAKRLANKAR